VKTKNRKIGQKGAAIVEFAIILPLLLILVFGIADVGILLHNSQVITNASREGARAGITRLTEAEIKNVVADYCNTNNRLLPPGTLLSVDDVDVLPTDPGAAAFQSDLTVTVNFAHNYMFAGVVGLGPKPLYAQTVMKMEPDPPPSP
jgi:Flp pilus assembly protein TadG